MGNHSGRMLLGLFCLVIPGAVFSATAKVSDFAARTQTISGGSKQIPYRLFIPANYNPSKAYPIMVTLHGAGERGTNNTAQLTHGFNLMWADSLNQARQQAFVLAPQCPPDPNKWVDWDWAKGSYSSTAIPQSDDLQGVMEILDSLGREFHLDTLRYYVSGISMGGYGTWDLLVRYPKKFAAAVMTCGGADTSRAALIKDVPIWDFHAADDPVVPVRASRQMIAALQAAGGTPKYTEYAAGAVPGGHESWKLAEKDSALVPWLQAQARTAEAVPVRAPEKSLGRGKTPPLAVMPDILGRRDGEFPALKATPVDAKNPPDRK